MAHPLRAAAFGGLLALVLLAVSAFTPPAFEPPSASAEPFGTSWSDRGPDQEPERVTLMREIPATRPVIHLLPDLDLIRQRLRDLLAVPPLEPVASVTSYSPLWDGTEAPEVSASAVAVLDEASMTLLYGKNPDQHRAPASLTKVATAILAIQSDQLDDVVTSDVDCWQMPGSSLMGLRPGDRFTLRDLMYGLILMSGNDAALAIARHLAGNDAMFVYRMNALARSLGLEDTHFTDPHGLGGPEHYSTARDMAILARYAMQFPELREIAHARSWTAWGTREVAPDDADVKRISMANYVTPFLDTIEGSDGLKTGYTTEAGPTFIGSAERDGRRIYVVLLNAQGDRFAEAGALLDWAFEHHEWPADAASSAVALPGAGAD